jgi:hypothetical protein
MLSLTKTPDRRPESPTLVVVTTALQLGLVVLVWLLALIPAAVAALVVLTYKMVRRLLGVRPPPPRGPYP